MNFLHQRPLKCKALMFLGTGSDVGKSIAATAFCRIFKRRGFRVAPFKAQNMSNNSYVTMEGGEIGRAQVVQAEAAGLRPSVHMNPILLKPSTGMGSQIVLHGKVFGQMNAVDYHAARPRLEEVLIDSYKRLSQEFDLIVIEGAGSCCEMNLKKNDLVNFSMARRAGAPCILIGDIDRGGVFAQLVGSHHLMTKNERNMTIGYMINKFRGEPKLFESGMEYIEKKTGKPVFGLIPFFKDIHIDPEDSVIIQEDRWTPRPINEKGVNIAVLKLPAISNFTDLEVIEREKDVVLNYLFRSGELLNAYDLLILPGTKNTIEDALWLGRSGWKKKIKAFVQGGGRVFGICGGYQLLGESIEDPSGVESDMKSVRGLGLLPIETTLAKKKIVRRVNGIVLKSGRQVSGYEIHMGESRILGKGADPFLKIHLPGKRMGWEDGCHANKGKIVGTYVHGILDRPGFRGEFLNSIRRAKGLGEHPPVKGRLARFHQYDLLADHFEAHCHVDKIIEMVENAFS